MSKLTNNAWIHRAFILEEWNHAPQNFTVNTAGFAFIDMLDSGTSFSLHNLDPQHLPHGHQ